jgi:hypothetical protein
MARHFLIEQQHKERKKNTKRQRQRDRTKIRYAENTDKKGETDESLKEITKR